MTQLITTRRAGAGVAIGALVTSALLFTPSAQAADAIADVRESQIAKNGTTTFGWYQADAAGTNQITNDGLELAGTSRVLNGYPAGSTVKLAALSTAQVERASGTAASFVLLLSDDAIAGGPATLRPSATAGEFTTDTAIGDIPAGDSATIDEIGAQVKDDYTVNGFGVDASGGTSTVKSIAFDGTTYLFKNTAPSAPSSTVSTRIETPLTVTLASSDVDGNELTYSVGGPVGGTVSATGTTATFTPARGFKGNGAFTYTVTDGRGGSSTGTVTVKVEKFKGKATIYRIHPSRPSVRSTVSVYAVVQVDGRPAAQGTTVHGYAKGKKVVTGKVNSTGKVKLRLPNKLPAGKATLKVVQSGSSKINGGSSSVAVRVRK
ncbi:Ig-like domain-containing protein [Aeromicrobium sp. Root472D3]|uniref:Ig-like domain-containing protein n=1 Tax=Aeromicrobium sp. Root472D3 TaxID=1736540 RepID=UPI0006FC7B03|nr:Ig-like domain-containing protein [Aeromicrobium sp. Root472D3]KQX73847.1 hypothetical protein ASD10_00805 [Aeromicrobium sp. Root472D3]